MLNCKQSITIIYEYSAVAIKYNQFNRQFMKQRNVDVNRH